ncbi:hypothetical protein [Spirosoma endbachense]|uniref:YkgJ family cysteine cluster protein n=1 Tax=Spirosoma endbachense TaxID=2666025 RepID=A0A6P1VYX2_9BACT|nr:hypothetical protein [Spirosoma endbachense]QHV96967.1 hypothetical protein GJR95_19005 [Spirosoma endbachense]
MKDLAVESPLNEQEICVKCGFCCDGTLFSYAVLQAGEQGNLPEKIEQNYSKEDGREFFKLPCSYFCGKCTIYDQKRASICSAFRCQLLKDFSIDKITQANAMRIIDNAVKFRDEIYLLYREIFGNDYRLSFRNLLVDLAKYGNDAFEDDPLNQSIELLRIKCNIYETLLIKNFKSIKNFERLISTSMEET